MLNPSLVHCANNSQSRLILINAVGHDQPISYHTAAPTLAWCYCWVSLMTKWERESKMSKNINVLLMSSDCMRYMCDCCWLKVVVVIAELKMPGGGCVPLIPYLILRSRGEALNPKHTHMRTLLQTRVCAHTCSCAILIFWHSQEKSILLYPVLHMKGNARHSFTHKHF